MGNKITFIAAIVLLPGAAFGLENNRADTTPEEQTQEDTILVRTTPTSQSMGTQILDKTQINQFPTGNGSVPELLKHNPAVRFANTTDSSTTPEKSRRKMSLSTVRNFITTISPLTGYRIIIR